MVIPRNPHVTLWIVTLRVAVEGGRIVACGPSRQVHILSVQILLLED